MIKKILIILGISVLAGCSARYDVKIENEHNENVVFLDNDKIIMEQNLNSVLVNVEILNEYFGSSVEPKIKVKITNKNKNILKLKANDFRFGFSNFWFDVTSYNILDEDRNENFHNDSNFKLYHDVLPDSSITFEITFKKPKSVEYYKNKRVLLEIYTSEGLFNFYYKIRKIN